MQGIPYGNLDDIERGRAEMQAFRQELDNEKHVWPNLTLTGEDIHCAFYAEETLPVFNDLPYVVQHVYNKVAAELNRELDARQAWFEGEDSEISAVRCPRCGEMFSNFKLREHPCL